MNGKRTDRTSAQHPYPTRHLNSFVSSSPHLLRFNRPMFDNVFTCSTIQLSQMPRLDRHEREKNGQNVRATSQSDSSSKSFGSSSLVGGKSHDSCKAWPADSRISLGNTSTEFFKVYLRNRHGGATRSGSQDPPATRPRATLWHEE